VICPSGHQTNQTDFCDVCGLPIAAGAADAAASVHTGSATATPAPAATLACPNCTTANVAEALFCEGCGYDFTTGAPAEPQWPAFSESAAPSQAAALGQPTQDSQSATPVSPAQLPTAQGPTAQGPVSTAPSTPVTAVPTPVADPAAESATPDSAQPKPAPTRPRVDWVAELWIDPDWYAAQGSTDPMPSAGLPDIVALVKENNLIGRVSHSKGIFPEIDCELDSGCSRRHAMVTTDWTRWWIEDLNSANGTFVGGAAGPLPAMPIPQGRVELTSGQRIYVGAWTRIVIRKATSDEQEAFA
jgi:hypothetical protein